MKKIIYAILMIVLSMPLCGYTIKGGVTYTVETARKEAFADVEYTLPKSIIEANKVDPNYQENMEAKTKGKDEFRDRYLTFFDDGGYGVEYKNNKYYEFYYDSNGELERIGKIVKFKFPFKTCIYNTQGMLVFIAYTVSYRDTYTFRVNGELDSHWIGDWCYDKNGNIVGKRR